MLLSLFAFMVLGILGCYYFMVILFDLLKSNTKAVQVTTHTVQFGKPEKPVVVSDETEKNASRVNSESDTKVIRFLPLEPREDKETRRQSPIVDLGLETLSGEPFSVNAENLSKFMIA